MYLLHLNVLEKLYGAEIVHHLRLVDNKLKTKMMNSLAKLRVYNQSESEEEEEEENKRLLLPLPNFFKDLTSKEKSLKEVNQDGKVRNFPHEPGNWVTYLYIPLDPTEFYSYINTLLNFFKPLELKLVDDFHISLTRTVILRHHWIPEFINGIKNNLSQTASFKIHFNGLKAFTNEEKTRSFLSLKVDEGEEDLKSIVDHLNNGLTDYNLQRFYEDPSFHVSLLWCSGEKCSAINKYIDLLPLDLKNFNFYKEVSYCACATGNKLFTFNFYK